LRNARYTLSGGARKTRWRRTVLVAMIILFLYCWSSAPVSINHFEDAARRH
jgi:hypothetical protein